MLLDGKVVIVTGGGRGIGACIARMCAQHGATVAAVYSQSADAAAKVVAGIEAQGGRAGAFQADVRETDQVQAMVAQVAERFGPPFGLVNNAIAAAERQARQRLARLPDMFDFGSARCQHRKAVGLMKEHAATVVNYRLRTLEHGAHRLTTYMAGKARWSDLAHAGRELGRTGHRQHDRSRLMITEKVDPEGEGSKGFGQKLPLRRHGSADEIGKGCVFFMSELASYVTGAYLPITGGRVTQMGA